MSRVILICISITLCSCKTVTPTAVQPHSNIINIRSSDKSTNIKLYKPNIIKPNIIKPNIIKYK